MKPTTFGAHLLVGVGRVRGGVLGGELEKDLLELRLGDDVVGQLERLHVRPRASVSFERGGRNSLEMVRRFYLKEGRQTLRRCRRKSPARITERNGTMYECSFYYNDD